MNWKYFLGYLTLIFILLIISSFLSPDMAATYLSIIIAVIGVMAIIWQKIFHKNSILDMGLRLNRKVLIGLGLITILIVVLFSLSYWIANQMNFIKIELNHNSSILQSFESTLIAIIMISIIEGSLMFPFAFFGEELAWRGYILPKLEEQYSKVKAVIINAFLFAIWHIPVYFSLYSGGILTQGWNFLVFNIVAHMLSVIPLCIIYLITRELYSISLYHVIVDLTQYYIIGNPSLGYASENAIYTMTVLNDNIIYFDVLVYVVSIILVIGFYMILKRKEKDERTEKI